MKINFKSSGRIEYAGLTSEATPESPSVLAGPLFKVVLGKDRPRIEELKDSRVSVSLDKEPQPVGVSVKNATSLPAWIPHY